MTKTRRNREKRRKENKVRFQNLHKTCAVHLQKNVNEIKLKKKNIKQMK